MVAAALASLGLVVRNDWETFMVSFGLIVLGLGQGALVTTVFNVLAAASPEELAGDVASLRGTTNNLAGPSAPRSPARPPIGLAALPLLVVVSVNVLMTLVVLPRASTCRSWPRSGSARPRSPPSAACGRW
jgi:hypothetical protein